MKLYLLIFFSLIINSSRGQSCESYKWIQLNQSESFDAIFTNFKLNLTSDIELNCFTQSVNFILSKKPRRGDYSESTHIYESIIENLKNKEIRADSILTWLHTKTGASYKRSKNQKKAHNHFNKAKEYGSQVYSVQDHAYKKLFYNIGETYYTENKFDESISATDTALHLYGYDTTTTTHVRLFENYSLCYANKGDAYLSDVYSRIYQVYADTFEKYLPLRKTIISAQCKYFLDQHEEGLSLLESISHERKNSKIDQETKKTISLDLYNLYKELGFFNKADHELDSYTDYNLNNIELAKYYNNKAAILPANDFEKKIEFYNSAIETALESNNYIDLSVAYIGAMSVCNKENKVEQAFQFYKAWKRDCLSKEVNNSSTGRKFSDLYRIVHLLIDYSDATKDTELLKEALEYVEINLRNFDDSANSYTDQNSLIRNLRDRKVILSWGVEICYKLSKPEPHTNHYTELALDLIEKSKSLILYFNSIKNLQSEKYSNAKLADSIKDSIDQLMVLVSNESDLKLSHKVQKSLKISKLARDLRKLYNLNTLPNYVQNDASKLNFRASENFLTIYKSESYENLYYRIDNNNRKLRIDTFSLSKSDISLIKNITNPDSIKNLPKINFQALSHKIIPESRPDKVIILPDGILSGFPFELLLHQEGDVPSPLQVSYGFSLRHLDEMSKIDLSSASTFLGYAPSYDSTLNENDKACNWVDLEYNDLEIKNISQLFESSEKNYGIDANKNNFTSDTFNSSIIHIAAHATASSNEDENFIYFGQCQDEALSLTDIYKLKIPADLVTLSACETSLGKDQVGEGVLSLAHGFAYAGAKSVVSTLWKVDDKSTAEIMESFYKYLSKGERKDAALRQAKLDYIENCESTIKKHPYYWAGFVLTGDTSPLPGSQRNNYWWALSVPVLAGLFLGYKRKAS